MNNSASDQLHRVSSATLSSHKLKIALEFEHQLLFAPGAWRDPEGTALKSALGEAKRVLVVLEKVLADKLPELAANIERQLAEREFSELLLIAGGEQCKEGLGTLQTLWSAIERTRLDRHSAVLCIGGGALLDVCGFAAATAHRGVRLVRMPSTTLSQDDSGVGVKNGVNLFEQKNYLGSFAVPQAVLIDTELVATQPEASRRMGYIEALKVAVVKDRPLFEFLSEKRAQLHALEPEAEAELIRRSALAHARHIAYGGDPFELGSSRPLDYGHWAAHKLEQLSGFTMSHAQAVAIGVALDTVYSKLLGKLSAEDSESILKWIEAMAMPLYDPLLAERDAEGRLLVLAGLEEFREHLGGELTILLLSGIGQAEEVHEMDHELIERAIHELQERAC